MSQPSISHQLAARLYGKLYFIRRFEESLIENYPSDKIKSPVHMSIGQEAVSVGVCDALAADDVVFGSYRGHALYLAHDGDAKAMMAELYGKVDGCARGKAGSMHLIDTAHGVMGSSAIVATNIPLAVGHALAAKLRGEKRLVAAFFGEGAMDEGAFAESLNFAQLKRLPVLFVCENNKYAIYSRIEERMANPDPLSRPRALGMPAAAVESHDVFEIRAAAVEAVARIRAGEGPQFLEYATYRWRDHVGPGEDRHIGYRTDEELDDWIGKDEVARVAALLEPGERRVIEAEAEAALAAAIEFAEASPFPAGAELAEHVHA